MGRSRPCPPLVIAAVAYLASESVDFRVETLSGNTKPSLFNGNVVRFGRARPDIVGGGIRAVGRLTVVDDCAN
jgi:hypothetical protein